MSSKKKFTLEEEKLRLEEMAEYERHFSNEGYEFIGGIDEAGRGPFVGPVVAACVILKKDAFIPGLNDSKKISETKRELLFDEIINQCVSFGIGQVDNKTIDEVNILNATKMAMRDAVNNMQVKPDFLLIDYVKFEKTTIPYLPIVKGDAKSVSIAAASILAKVTRDRQLRELSKEYPEYNFSKNKGYGTKEHIDALEQYGPCPLHRRTFIKKYIYKD